MADNNNNNNGNPIVNPNQNTNSNADLATVLAQLNTTLQNMQNRSNNNSNDNLSAETKRVLTLLERDSKKLNASLSNIERNNKRQEKDNLKSLNDIRKSAALGNTDYQKFLDKFKDQIAKYEELVKKQTELKTKQESAEKEKSSLESQIRRLREAIDSTQSDDEKEKLRDKLTELTTKLEDAKDAFNEASEELQHTNNQLNQNDMKGISKAASDIANHTQTTAKATRQLNKDNNSNSRAERKTLDDLGVHLSDVFEGGLFNLGNSLGGTLDKIRNNSLQNLSNRSPIGSLISFGIQTLSSVIDYQTKLLSEGVGNLQTSFETTGISISQAILVDKDEVAEMYGSWAEELKEQGYDVALTATDAANLANSFAQAGITDPEMIKELALEAMKSSALTGSAVTDFTDKEFLTNLSAAMRSGEVTDLEGFFEGYTKSITGAIDASGGLRFSQAQTQDFLNQYTTNVLTQGNEAANEIMSTNLAFAGASSELGVTGLGNTILESINKTIESGINDETLAALSGYAFSQDLRSSNRSDVIEGYLDALTEFDTMQDATQRDYLATNVFGVSATDIEKLINSAGGIEALREEFRKNLDTIQNDTSEYERRKAVVQTHTDISTGLATSGIVTTEQGLKNKATNDAAAMWEVAELSHIPEASKMLQEGIETAGNGVETAIAVAADLLLSGILGSGGLQGLGSLLGSGFGSIGSLLSAAGPIAVPLATAAAIGFTIKSLIDDAGDALLELSDEEKAEQNARRIGEEVAEQNAEKNKESQKIMATQLEDIKAISKNTKEITSALYDKDNHGYAETSFAASTDVTDKRDTVGKSAAELLNTLSDNRGVLEYTGEQKIGGVYGKGSVLYYDSDKGTYQIASDSALHNSRTLSEEDLARIFTDPNFDAGAKILREDGTLQDYDTDSEEYKRIIEDFQTNQAALEQYQTGINKDYQLIANSMFWDAYQNYQDALFGADSNNVLSQMVDDVYGQNWTESEKQGLIAELNSRLNAIRPNFEKVEQLKQLRTVLAKLSSENIMTVKEAKEAIKSGNTEEIDTMANKLRYIRLPGNYSDLIPYINFNSDSLGDLSLHYVDKISDAFTPESVTPLAVGLNYVPYDNFPAMLHKGERVVTAADARLENLLEDVRYGLETNNNLYSNDDNIELLDTTNNSIVDGFDTTNKNQTTIIEALSVIISALQSNNTINYNNPFEMIKNDFIAQRQSNAAATSSVH